MSENQDIRSIARTSTAGPALMGAPQVTLSPSHRKLVKWEQKVIQLNLVTSLRWDQGAIDLYFDEENTESLNVLAHETVRDVLKQPDMDAAAVVDYIASIIVQFWVDPTNVFLDLSKTLSTMGAKKQDEPSNTAGRPAEETPTDAGAAA